MKRTPTAPHTTKLCRISTVAISLGFLVLVASLVVIPTIHFYCLSPHLSSQSNDPISWIPPPPPPPPRQRQRQRQRQQHVVPESIPPVVPLFPTGRGKKNEDDSCDAEYKRVTASLVSSLGLSEEVLDRSKLYLGNRERLAVLAQKLGREKNSPVHVAVCGGSITLGHGVQPATLRYSDQLERWLNMYYPLEEQVGNRQNSQQQQKQHKVYNMGAHGADMCSMAKRINFLEFPHGITPDLFLLEFGVNDYQGQDHKVHLDHKTSVFFNGFDNFAACAEVVIHRLLTEFPNAAVVFLEFQTAILNRKTAQLLHLGAALHYEVPVISYAQALFPEFYRLVEKLRPYNYSVPYSTDIQSILPFPHGCSTCHPEQIVASFRNGGCKSLCVFMLRSGRYQGPPCDTTGRPCYTSFFAHDAVHPSVTGHEIAAALIADLIADTACKTCRGRTFPQHLLPTHSGWMVSGPNYHQELRARSDFVSVQDTIEVFAKQNPLISRDHSPGFWLKGDQFADRMGWQANNTKGGEYITFDIHLPTYKCYEVFLSVLRSYETVGSFTVTVLDQQTNRTTEPQHFDCLWEPRISVPGDFQLTTSSSKTPPQCTGQCQIRVVTNPEIPNRKGNKIKIMSLAVRKCISFKIG